MPLHSSPAVDNGEIRAIPQKFSFVVLRENVDVVVDESAFFTSDRVGIRATMRVGFGHPHPATVVKINVSTGS